ncbi:MAG: GspH/FimT family pseudopilin [Elusimicrobiota bacterium]
MKRTRSNSGFTLIELALTAAVISIIVMIAWPALNGITAEMRLENTAKNIAAAMAYARDASVFEGRRYRVNIDIFQRSFDLSVENDPVNEPGHYEKLRDSLTLGQKFPDDIEIKALSVREVNFEPDGTSEDFRIFLSNQKNSEISVTINGADGKCTVKRMS